MITFLYGRNVCICLICALYHFIGGLSIEVATKMPPRMQEILKDTNMSEVRNILNGTRRILMGSEATDSRPYMVYLKLPLQSPKFNQYREWICGGVIVHEEFILTSAACIEDVKHFYVVSGTFKHSPEFDRHNNPCIKNGAKKAVWKCIPKNYIFDGHENDNIRWMNNDIAVVRVDEEFDFTRRVKGCDFIPRPVCYNNQSTGLEAEDTVASIAGWGSTEKYNDWVNSRKSVPGAQDLLETAVKIMPKKTCKKRWGKRYHNIIDNYMICTMDQGSDPSEICNEKYVDCTELISSEEDNRRRVLDPGKLVLHSAYHNESGRRQNPNDKLDQGGFCENDHGGPLVYGKGTYSIVIGIISACLVREKTNRCYGPFLYTSIFKNRVLINCAIYKKTGQECQKLFRSGDTHTEVVMSWVDHPDGPAKTEIKAMRRAQEKKLNESLSTTETIYSVNSNVSRSKLPVAQGRNTSYLPDKPFEQLGLIFRVHKPQKEYVNAIYQELSTPTQRYQKANATISVEHYQELTKPITISTISEVATTNKTSP